MGDYYDNNEDKNQSIDDEYANALDKDKSVFKRGDYADSYILTEQQKLFLESLHNDHERISEINDNLIGHSVDYIS